MELYINACSRAHELSSFIYYSIFHLYFVFNFPSTSKNIFHKVNDIQSIPTEKISLRRLGRRWEDTIRMDLEEIGIIAGNWVDSAKDRNYWRALVNAALNLWVP